MKKFMKFCMIALATVLSVSFSACNNDDELLNLTDNDHELLRKYSDDAEIFGTLKEYSVTEDQEERVVYAHEFLRGEPSWAEGDGNLYLMTFNQRKDDPQHAPILFTSINYPGKKKNLKAGDVIPTDYMFVMDSTSSHMCDVKDIKTSGTITVLEVSNNIIVLKFENFVYTQIADPFCHHLFEFSINGVLTYKRSNSSNEETANSLN